MTGDRAADIAKGYRVPPHLEPANDTDLTGASDPDGVRLKGNGERPCGVGTGEGRHLGGSDDGSERERE